MPFNARDFLPSPSDWFSADVGYEGWGRAEFADPKGSLRGPVSVRFDETGGASIEMAPDPSTLQCERPLRFGLDEFLSGEKLTRAGDHYVLSRTLDSRNPCVGLAVETPAGVFRTRDVPYYGTGGVFGPDAGSGFQKIRFDALWSQFDAAGAREPKYWVVPLSNFVTDWRWPAPDELDRHPLRIFPTPEVPDEVTHVLYGPEYEKRMQRATMAEKMRSICASEPSRTAN